jgi:hypothetical protein
MDENMCRLYSILAFLRKVKSAKKNCSRKPESRRPLEIFRYKWGLNIHVYLKKIALWVVNNS